VITNNFEDPAVSVLRIKNSLLPLTRRQDVTLQKTKLVSVFAIRISVTIH